MVACGQRQRWNYGDSALFSMFARLPGVKLNSWLDLHCGAADIGIGAAEWAAKHFLDRNAEQTGKASERSGRGKEIVHLSP
ncbi:MAG: hypothetical protein E5X67_03895 [Mesorhizobium sp.]|uniref:hypothetical protein n=1 Tax=Mesorhizobium sp. TaxID=1871066 RepID=UPI001229F27E|nr:hypothetical protein [Mesorhizobium sp.]TIP30211.1 MAG: hypothetical protein E5X67_03895 [Mesorhizobium sp.]